MSIDIKELKRLARKVAECEDQPEIADEHAEAADALWLHMHCHTILGLIDEIERRDESPNFRAVQSARQEAERLKAENEALANLLTRFVDGEHDQDEDVNERHEYHGEAQSLLMRMGGEFREYSLVPNDALFAQHQQLSALRKAADRYTWLRNKQTFIWLIQDWFPGAELTDVDAEIDAAMAKERGQ